MKDELTDSLESPLDQSISLEDIPISKDFRDWILRCFSSDKQETIRQMKELLEAIKAKIFTMNLDDDDVSQVVRESLLNSRGVVETTGEFQHPSLSRLGDTTKGISLAAAKNELLVEQTNAILHFLKNGGGSSSPKRKSSGGKKR